MKHPAVLVALALLACRSVERSGIGSGLPPGAHERIDALFSEWDRSDSPGCALGVIRGGELVHARGFGSANLEHGIAITPRSVFDIGSTSKQFTAACIGLLAQEGKLSVDDDLRAHVPEIPDYGKPITLAHLLHHTSGLRDYLTLFALAGIATEDLTDGETALAMLARQKELEFEPGSEHAYSNSGYFLLSLVVERASGESLAEYARRRIFEPLGMGDTHFHDDHTQLVPRRATGHAPLPGRGFGIDMSDFEQTGDGAVMTTVEDLARWDANFYRPEVGGAELVEFLRTHGTLADGTVLDYCRGLFRGEHEGLPFESHGGAWAGYRADCLRFPTQGTSVICLANLASIDPSDLCWKTAALVLGEALPPMEEPAAAEEQVDGEEPEAEPQPMSSGSPWTPTRDHLAELAGDYACDELGVVYSLEVREDVLALGLRGREQLPLTPLARDEFDLYGARMRFERGENGRAIGFRLEAGRVRNLRCARVP
jgi:CubicO group peptidase (beta-lactamase class C family)